MEFRSIRYALAVNKERSFTRASARLNVSQSAVSEQVKLLEARIGFALFRRTGQGVEPTDRGRAFLAEAERVANDLLNLQDVAKRLSGVGVDALTLGLGSGLASAVVPRLFPTGSLPANLRLEIRTAPTRVIFDELAAERLDVGVSVEVPRDSLPAGIVSAALFDLNMALCLPPRHRLCALSGPIALADLAEEDLITSELSVGYGPLVMAAFADQGLRPMVRASADNIDTIKSMVQAGLGVAIIPVESAAAEHAGGMLQLRALQPAFRVQLHLYQVRGSLSQRRQKIVEDLFGGFFQTANA